MVCDMTASKCHQFGTCLVEELPSVGDAVELEEDSIYPLN